jgi:hypothetical protein
MATFAVVAMNGRTIQPLMLFEDLAEAEAIADELRRRRHHIEVLAVDAPTAPSWAMWDRSRLGTRPSFN